MKFKTVKLGDICNISSSKRIFAKEYQNHGIPFYRGKEIIEKHNGKNVSTELYITKKRYEEIKSKFDVPKLGDILLTSVGTLGIPWYVSENNFYFKDGNLTWIRANENIVNSKFLYLWLNSYFAKNQIDTMCIGSTQKALTIDILKKFNISIPPLETQKKIASILSALDDKIELNNKINENLEMQAQAIFKSWFVDFENIERVTCHANEYFDISIGKTPPRKEHEWFSNNKFDNIKWVSISDMGNCGIYINDSSEYLTRKAIDKFNIKIVPKNTILLSFKLTIGRIAITNDIMATNEAIAHFKTKNQNIIEYLYCYLKNFNFQELGSTSSIATAVNSKIIKSMPFTIPTNKELANFHNVTNGMFNEIRKNQEENQRLAELRDTLLPKLMNGEIDVDDVQVKE